MAFIRFLEQTGRIETSGELGEFLAGLRGDGCVAMWNPEGHGSGEGLHY